MYVDELELKVTILQGLAGKEDGISGTAFFESLLSNNYGKMLETRQRLFLEELRHICSLRGKERRVLSHCVWRAIKRASERSPAEQKETVLPVLLSDEILSTLCELFGLCQHDSEWMRIRAAIPVISLWMPRATFLWMCQNLPVFMHALLHVWEEPSSSRFPRAKRIVLRMLATCDAVHLGMCTSPYATRILQQFRRNKYNTRLRKARKKYFEAKLPVEERLLMNRLRCRRQKSGSVDTAVPARLFGAKLPHELSDTVI